VKRLSKLKLSLLGCSVIVICLTNSPFAQDKTPAGSTTTGDSQSASNYLLGPGDVLEVKIYGQPDLSSTHRVDSEGNLSSLPFIEPIPAKCRNEREVQKDIAAAYTKLIVDPQVSVRIVGQNSRQPAAVFGAVHKPTSVPMIRAVRLNELIAASGGITERASGTIQILHTEPVMCPLPGEEAQALPLDGTNLPLQVVEIAEMKSGKFAANPPIRPGDYVLVSEAELVYVTGSVISPGSQLLTDKLTLSRVLAMSGGTRSGAKLSDVRIYRQRTGSVRQDVLKVDYAAIKQNKAPDVFLKPFDVIEVTDPGITFGGVVKDLLAGALRSYPLVPRIP